MTTKNNEGVVLTPSPTTFNIHLLHDAELPETAKWNGAVFNSQELIVKLLKFWREQLNYTGKVCGVMVNAGYSFKALLQEGECYEGPQHLLGWGIPNEERTRDIIFLAPPVLCRALLNKNDAQ